MKTPYVNNKEESKRRMRLTQMGLVDNSYRRATRAIGARSAAGDSASSVFRNYEFSGRGQGEDEETQKKIDTNKSAFDNVVSFNIGHNEIQDSKSSCSSHSISKLS